MTKKQYSSLVSLVGSLTSENLLTAYYILFGMEYSHKAIKDFMVRMLIEALEGKEIQTTYAELKYFSRYHNWKFTKILKVFNSEEEFHERRKELEEAYQMSISFPSLDPLRATGYKVPIDEHFPALVIRRVKEINSGEYDIRAVHETIYKEGRCLEVLAVETKDYKTTYGKPSKYLNKPNYLIKNPRLQVAARDIIKHFLETNKIQ